MVHLVTQDTAVTRQTPAAKSHPFESNTLQLLPVENLRKLVATHPAAVGVEWSIHVWAPFFAGLPCQQTGFTFGKQPVLAERYVHAFNLPAVAFLHRMSCMQFLLEIRVHLWEAHRLFVTIVVP